MFFLRSGSQRYSRPSRNWWKLGHSAHLLVILRLKRFSTHRIDLWSASTRDSLAAQGHGVALFMYIRNLILIRRGTRFRPCRELRFWTFGEKNVYVDAYLASASIDRSSAKDPPLENVGILEYEPETARCRIASSSFPDSRDGGGAEQALYVLCLARGLWVEAADPLCVARLIAISNVSGHNRHACG